MEPLTVTIGGDMPVRRIGYGTMQLTGPGHWGPPADTGNALRILRHAVHDLGIDHLDTADAYGPHTVEDLIRQALHPTASRSIVGVMNDYVSLANTHRDHGDELSLLDLSLRLSRTPFRPLYSRNVSPDRELAAMTRTG